MGGVVTHKVWDCPRMKAFPTSLFVYTVRRLTLYFTVESPKVWSSEAGVEQHTKRNSVAVQDFQRKFFYDSVYKHSVDPGAPVADKVEAAYCK